MEKHSSTARVSLYTSFMLSAYTDLGICAGVYDIFTVEVASGKTLTVTL